MKDEFQWLNAAAQRVIEQVHCIGAEGIHYWAPAISAYNSGCWMRDFAYMLCHGPEDAFEWSQVRRTLERFISLQTPDGAVPDFVVLEKSDGATELTRPATYAVFGGHAVEDNPMFLVLAIERASQVLGDDSLWRDHADALMKGLGSVSRCPASGLVFINPLEPHSGYGFCDTVDKRGHDLFCSLLWWEAAGLLAGGLKRIGRAADAQALEQAADWLRMHLMPAFWDEKEGLLQAATVWNRQADLWGSAYAVTIGAIDAGVADRIGQTLLKHYDLIVRHGQVRHTLLPSWMHMLSDAYDYRSHATGVQGGLVAPGAYQNGGFWATPTAWVARAIARVERGRARQMVLDCIHYFQTRGIFECIDVDESAGPEGRGRVADYVASATNVLAAEDLFQS